MVIGVCEIPLHNGLNYFSNNYQLNLNCRSFHGDLCMFELILFVLQGFSVFP